MSPAPANHTPGSWSDLEGRLFGRGFNLVAGVDEVGRGPLAGPVVAAAAILPPGLEIKGLNDSKLLSPKFREELALEIRERSRAWALGVCSPREVDDLNIHHASLAAMQRAVASLEPSPHYLIIDGRFCLEVDTPQEAVVGGDRKVRAVAAASILAKVHRDGLMARYHQDYPQYNFAANKGYGTLEHREALERLGPCRLHRRSFRPVSQMSLGLGHEK